jgi:cysteinyl-tRNA synthetase
MDPERFLKGKKAPLIITPEPAVAGAGTSLGGVEERWRVPDEMIEDRIEKRTAARKAKDWAESDRIRDELKAAGVILEDGPQGTTWRRA